jgi:hypothetical protein
MWYLKQNLMKSGKSKLIDKDRHQEVLLFIYKQNSGTCLYCIGIKQARKKGTRD